MTEIKKAWKNAGIHLPSPEYASPEYVRLLFDVKAIKEANGLQGYLEALVRIEEEPRSPEFLRGPKEMGLRELTIGERQEWRRVRTMPRNAFQAVCASAQ